MQLSEGADMAAGKKADAGEQPEKMDLRSLDIAAERRAELLRLFPEVRTEGGKIDFERLQRALGEMIDVGRERYGLTWPGKADCFRTIQAPSLGTLRPGAGRERQLRHDREPDHRGRQPGGAEAPAEVVPRQGQDDLHRPALQHRQRLHLPRQLRRKR